MNEGTRWIVETFTNSGINILEENGQRMLDIEKEEYVDYVRAELGKLEKEDFAKYKDVLSLMLIQSDFCYEIKHQKFEENEYDENDEQLSPNDIHDLYKAQDYFMLMLEEAPNIEYLIKFIGDVDILESIIVFYAEFLVEALGEFAYYHRFTEVSTTAMYKKFMSKELFIEVFTWAVKTGVKEDPAILIEMISEYYEDTGKIEEALDLHCFIVQSNLGSADAENLAIYLLEIIQTAYLGAKMRILCGDTSEENKALYEAYNFEEDYILNSCQTLMCIDAIPPPFFELLLKNNILITNMDKELESVYLKEETKTEIAEHIKKFHKKD